MSDWQRDTTPRHLHPAGTTGLFALPPAPAARRAPASYGPSQITSAGAEWLASASAFPDSVHALWRHRPSAPSTLPCGTAFDVVSTPPLLGRRILDRLWTTGPGSGPVAVHRGRLLLFAAPGTSDRLPALLSWGEWQEEPSRRPAPGEPGPTSAETFPHLLCHGLGDTVTVPALHPGPHPASGAAGASRWLVAPDLRHPWLPGAGVLLRACLRGRRPRGTPVPPTSVPAGRGPAGTEQPIFETAERDAKVYDVSRRR